MESNVDDAAILCRDGGLVLSGFVAEGEEVRLAARGFEGRVVEVDLRAGEDGDAGGGEREVGCDGDCLVGFVEGGEGDVDVGEVRRELFEIWDLGLFLGIVLLAFFGDPGVKARSDAIGQVVGDAAVAVGAKSAGTVDGLWSTLDAVDGDAHLYAVALLSPLGTKFDVGDVGSKDIDSDRSSEMQLPGLRLVQATCGKGWSGARVESSLLGRSKG